VSDKQPGRPNRAIGRERAVEVSPTSDPYALDPLTAASSYLRFPISLTFPATSPKVTRFPRE